MHQGAAPERATPLAATRHDQFIPPPSPVYTAAAALGTQRGWGDRRPRRVVEPVFAGVRVDVVQGTALCAEPLGFTRKKARHGQTGRLVT